jgi:hypothetical protein
MNDKLLKTLLLGQDNMKLEVLILSKNQKLRKKDQKSSIKPILLKITLTDLAIRFYLRRLKMNFLGLPTIPQN